MGPSAESPIQNLNKNATYMSMSPAKPTAQMTGNNVNIQHRRRTLSDYRTEVNSSTTVVDSNSNGKAVSSIKNATKTLTTGLSKFTARRMVRQRKAFINIKKLYQVMHFSSLTVKHRSKAALKFKQ